VYSGDADQAVSEGLAGIFACLTATTSLAVGADLWQLVARTPMAAADRIAIRMGLLLYGQFVRWI
jgi:hypothetical protein